MSALPLAGKVAVVTGASRSIGAAIAVRLALDGANVFVNYVNDGKAAEEVVSQIAVNNAASAGSKTLEQIDEAFFDSLFNLNVKSPLFLTQAAVKHMAPGSRVIFFSSSLVSASTVLRNSLVYVGSQGAVEQFTRVLSKNLASKGINVHCVSPSPTDTPLFRQGKPDDAIKHIASLTPFDRLGQVEDIRGIVTFLAGPEATWIRGQHIRINGAFAV